jgi:tetratricopeptide (TPR) repeat protein
LFFEGLTLLKLDRPLQALDSLQRAERAGLRTALVSETRGDAHYNLAQFEKAFERYSTALKQEPENPNLLSKSGLALLRTGKTDAGLGRLREAIQRRPASPELHDRLILGCVALVRMRDAAEAAQSKLDAVPQPQPGDFLRAASLWVKANDCSRAAATVRAGLALFPENEKLLMALGEVENAGGAPTLTIGSK